VERAVVEPRSTRLSALGRIEDVDDLHRHRQYAVELEHVTLPPYLCALGEAVGSVCDLEALANALLQLPIDGGPEVAGLTFEWVPPELR
jgi:hypothetical protein